jgi:hypothetical protein
LNLGVSRNRFCDFLADPDSRSFSRFGAIILQVAVAGSFRLSFIGCSFLFSAIDFTAKKRGHVAPARTKFAHGRTEARRVSFADLRAVRGEHLPLVRAGDLHRITALRAQSFKDRRRNPTHFGFCLSLE